MNRAILILSHVCFAIVLRAQIYQEIATPFDGVSYGSIAFSDIDNDSDQDVFISGKNAMNQAISKMYVNDGNGLFTETLNTSFENVLESAIAFSDIDNDGDGDIMITGLNDEGEKIAKLYLNDGNGNFTEDIRTTFEGVSQSAIAFSDIDNDGDRDLLITGSYQFDTGFTRLYINNGNGVFEEVPESTLVGVKNGSISCTDIDGDGDQDVLITGRGVFSQDQISRIYLNNGSGQFTESNNNIVQVSESSTAFADIDSDNDLDLFITGTHNSDSISKLYLNDGNGTFTEKVDSTFENVNFSSIAFSDIDNDNDQDLLITGENNSFDNLAIIYLNDSVGNFKADQNSEIEGVFNGSVAFAEVNGDDKIDLLISGYSDSFREICKLYINQFATSLLNYKRIKSKFKICPNPSQAQKLILRCDNKVDMKNLEVHIYNSNGQEVQTLDAMMKIGEKEIAINNLNLISGLYYLTIRHKHVKETIEFIIE